MRSSIAISSVFLLAGCVGQAHAQTPPRGSDAGAQATAVNGSARAAAERHSVLGVLEAQGPVRSNVLSGDGGSLSVVDALSSERASPQTSAQQTSAPQGGPVGTIGMGSLGTRSRAIGGGGAPASIGRMLRGRTSVRGPGFAEAVAIRVMRRWNAQFQYCFDTIVGRANAAPLSVTMSFNVRAAGEQRTENLDVSFVGTTDPRLITCLRSRLAPVQFPTPVGAQRVPVVHVFSY